LNRSKRTIDSRRAKIMQKLNINRGAELMRAAVQYAEFIEK